MVVRDHFCKNKSCVQQVSLLTAAILTNRKHSCHVYFCCCLDEERKNIVLL